MIFLIALMAAILFNFYIVVFGSADIQKLKQSISISKYIQEMNVSLTDALGDKPATALKLLLIALSVMLVIFNALFFIQVILGIIIGTFGAKKLGQMGAVSNWLNKIKTYINRIR